MRQQIESMIKLVKGKIAEPDFDDACTGYREACLGSLESLRKLHNYEPETRSLLKAEERARDFADDMRDEALEQEHWVNGMPEGGGE